MKDYSLTATISLQDKIEDDFLDEFTELCERYGEFYASSLNPIQEEE